MSGWENVLENDGVTIAIAGMAVVFSALIVISLFISLLPHALKQLHRIAPEPEEHHVSAPLSGPTPVSEDQAIAAAIGYAMYLQAQRAK